MHRLTCNLCFQNGIGSAAGCDNSGCRKHTWGRLSEILICSWGNPSLALPKPDSVVKGRGTVSSPCGAPW